MEKLSFKSVDSVRVTHKTKHQGNLSRFIDITAAGTAMTSSSIN